MVGDGLLHVPIFLRDGSC